MRKSIYTPAHRQLLLLLRQIRQEALLTQEELGQRVGADQSEVSHWETGEKRLDLLEICQIVDAVGLPLREFIARFETMTGRS